MTAIAAATTAATPAQRLLNDVMGLSARPETGARVPAGAAPTGTPAAAASSDETPREEASGEVSLSPAATNANVEPQLPRVYAEVWRNGLKVAVIDANGGVRGLTGMVASQEGTGGPAGILLAARRAAELAAAVGGEIRVGGEPMPATALATRAKLAVTYGLGSGS